jgi:hypothetical protein
MNQLEKALADLFAKLPNLPANIRALIVKVAPYFAILGVVLGLPAILALLGLGSVAAQLTTMSGMWVTSSAIGLSVVFVIGSIVLQALSIPGLFARKIAGWRFAYWAVLLGGVQNLLMMNLMGFVISTGIGLYLLFEIRSSYH